MIEIEAKVRLSDEQALAIKKELSQLGKGKKVSKSDKYYTMSSLYSLRTRESGIEKQLTLKSKRKIGKGVEANQEMEWKIKSAKKMEVLLNELGFTQQKEKKKHSEIYRLNGMTLELSHLEGIGWFLEIEKLVKDESGIKEAKKDLLNHFKQFGFSENDLEKKYYLEILKESESLVSK